VTNTGDSPPFHAMILSVHHHRPTMTFSALTFSDHVIPGGTKARYTFANEWTISVVAGPEDSGLYGVISEDTFEVAVIRPNGNMLDDVIPYQTPVQITSLMHLIEML
jgi:hypothetical protein